MLPAELIFDRFTTNIRQAKLFEPHHQILLAVSGGMDSMVMLELFRRSDYSFGIAHCNFRLRGKEADKDQQMVERVANNLGVSLFTTSFDTKTYAVNHKLSIQMAARDLRYEWLENVRQENGFDLIATAHHLDDSMETLFINLSRGTGISGLTGIPARSNKVIRPLLFAIRKDIESFVKEHDITYREDASNTEEKYQRNKVRHQLIPVMQELNPSLRSTMKEFFPRMQAVADIYNEAIEQARQSCIQHEGEAVRILIPQLLSMNHQEVFLYEFLKEYGFVPAVCKDIANNLTRQSGKLFYSDTHTLLSDRQALLVYPTTRDETEHVSSIYEHTKQLRINDYTLHFEHIDLAAIPMPGWPEDQNTILLDYSKLRFPLQIRHWEKGDKMHPLGMSGSKKISDLFTEHKIPVRNKKRIPIIVSGDEIVWVVGIRSSNKFKIKANTKKILRITYDCHKKT